MFLKSALFPWNHQGYVRVTSYGSWIVTIISIWALFWSLPFWVFPAILFAWTPWLWYSTIRMLYELKQDADRHKERTRQYERITAALDNHDLSNLLPEDQEELQVVWARMYLQERD